MIRAAQGSDRLNARDLLLPVAVAIVIRLVAIWATGASTTAFGDAGDYQLHAAILCAEGTYPERGNNLFFRAPGFPVFIAAVTACSPERIAAVKIGLAAIDALTVALIGWLAWRLGCGRMGSRFAAALAAVYPPFVFQVCDLHSEPVFMFLLTCGLLLSLSRLGPNGAGGRSFPAGVSLGLAALTRPAALLAVVYFSLAGLFQPSQARRWHQAALLLAGALVCVGPWAVRNHLRYGEILLVNDAAGINLWRGASPILRRALTADDPGQRDAALADFDHQVALLGRTIDAEATSPAARDRAWRRLALTEIRRDPLAYLKFAGRKALGYWRPWLSPRFHTPREVWLSAVAILPLMVAGLAGLLLLHRREPWLFLVLGGFLTLGWLAQVPFQTVMRFRIPFTDPLLLALAPLFLREIGRRWRHWPRWPAKPTQQERFAP